ncbi:hypothetical protein DLAC_02477 [Tieghemostelium lacteum]|uniref:Uncharacterized protein n=1 Tax=Tieghemostelium lacteum TaxID=361077 RepID=A0A152A2P6_TIELA|nr:hypothetical protein DLAC_02477 [Tieghemostelium lacteum]|eukprot:KYR00474.1 hypothetical protein DLAC_02477 [Tieghemostelium lacteum]
MSRISFATSQWKIKIKRGINRIPIGFNQILMEGIPYSLPPKPQKKLRVIESPILEYAKEFANEHREIGYLDDGRLSQDSMNFSYMKFNYLKKGLSFQQASLQAKRDLVKQIEIRSMELDMIQNQALKMGIPSFRPKTHLEHIDHLYQKVQERKDEFESINRRESLEETLRVKVLYNDFTPLTFTQVSPLTPKEFVKFVKEHADYKKILSYPVTEDKKSSEEEESDDLPDESTGDKEAQQQQQQQQKKQEEVSQILQKSGPNILGFTLEDYNNALGFNKTSNKKSGGEAGQEKSLLGDFEKSLADFESQMGDSSSPSSAMMGIVNQMQDINFISNIKSGMDKSLIGNLNDYSIQLNPNSGRLELISSSTIEKDLKQKVGNKFKKNSRLSIISSIETMHHLSGEGKVSAELMAYVNRDEGSSSASTGVSTASKEYALYKSSLSYIKNDLSNIDQLKQLIDYNEIPLDFSEDSQSKSDQLEDSIKTTINEISQEIYVNPTLNMIGQGNGEDLHTPEGMQKAIEQKWNESELRALKGPMKVTQDGHYDLTQSNIHSTYDFVDFEVFERQNREYMEQYEKEQKEKMKIIEESEEEPISVQKLIDQEANAIAKGESHANPEVLKIANQTRSNFFGDRFRRPHNAEMQNILMDYAPLSKTAKTLEYYQDVFSSYEAVHHKEESDAFLDLLAERQETNEKLNILNRDMDKEDRVDFRTIQLPQKLQDKYSGLINEFKAKEAKGQLVESDYYEFTNYLNYLIQQEDEPYTIQRLRSLEGLPATPINTKIQDYNSTLPVGETVPEQEIHDHPVFKALKEMYPDPQEREEQIAKLLYKGKTLEGVEELQDLQDLRNIYIQTDFKKNIVDDVDLQNKVAQSIKLSDKLTKEESISLDANDSLAKDDVQYNDYKNLDDVKNAF